MQKQPYLIGASYYPEQWDQNRWEADFAKMAELGFNCVRMGEFAWSHFERRKSEFSFQWMDAAIALAASYNIKTVLCTPTASPPPWLRRERPEVLGGNEKGPFRYGARKGYCVNAEAFLLAADRIVTAVADHFGDNPDIIAWQLDNEPGYPFVCYDSNCLEAFRRWLERRYQTLDNLNAAWGTSFWSHVYNDWDEIEMPINVGDGDWNPGEKLDYRRFFSDSFIAYLSRQSRILRPRLKNGVFVFTNWPNTFWSVDTYEAYREVGLDATAWDNYSAIPGITDYRKQFGPAMQHDLARCTSPTQRFLLAEQAARMPATALQAGIGLQTWQDIAHGAFGTIFFEWRSPLAGAEQGYASILNVDGSFGPAAEELKTLTSALAKVPSITTARTQADVAILFSYADQWYQGFWGGETGYDSHAERWYIGLKALGRDIDVISPAHPIERYKVIVAPRLQIVDAEMLAKLERFVSAGGILVADPGFATKDPYNRLHEMPFLGQLSRLTGVAVRNTASRQAIAGNLITGAADQGVQQGSLEVRLEGVSEPFHPWRVVERIEIFDARPLAVFSGGNLDGEAAATLRSLGAGHLLYVCFDTQTSDFYEAIAGWIGKTFDVRPLLPGVPKDVEVTSRTEGSQRTIFLLNLTAELRSIDLHESLSVLLGEQTAGKLVLPPCGAGIVSQPVQ